MQTSHLNPGGTPFVPAVFVQSSIKTSFSLLETGSPSHKILPFLIEAAEKLAGNDSVSSILVLDDQGLLRNGSSPQLPYDYLTAIDGIRPNPNVGTCAAAAATGNVVITFDFRADDKWQELKHLPLSLGFRGAWSMPIKSNEGKVIGTFGTYFRQCRTPSEDEIKNVSLLADAAAKILHLQKNIA